MVTTRGLTEMRLLSACTLMIALSAAPAFAQTVASAATPAPLPVPAASAPTAAAETPNPSVDYNALREDIARTNKSLTDQVANQRAIAKRNGDLLKEAQRLQAANLKLNEEKKKLQAENADLDKQRAALQAAQPKNDAN
jgi:septal ring factor EnvC (AmiA/AmiB activator)